MQHQVHQVLVYHKRVSEAVTVGPFQYPAVKVLQHVAFIVVSKRQTAALGQMKKTLIGQFCSECSEKGYYRIYTTRATEIL